MGVFAELSSPCAAAGVCSAPPVSPMLPVVTTPTSATMSNDQNSLSVPFPCRIAVIQQSGEEGKSFEFDTKKWCLLGSHPDCDIRIKHGLNAPLHALVFVRPDGVYLQGVHSEIPVVHSRTGIELVREKELRLSPGDSFHLGSRSFRVHFENPAGKSPKSPCVSVPEHVGPRTRSSKAAELFKQLQKVSVVANPFDRRATTAREFLRRARAPPVKRSNPKLQTELKISEEYGNPTIELVYADGFQQKIHTSALKIMDIMDQVERVARRKGDGAGNRLRHL